MKSTANTESDRAVEIVPEISHTVPWRVTSVVVLPDARLEVPSTNVTSGKVEMQAFLGSSKVDSTVFEPLRDAAVFAEARVGIGAVQWLTAPTSHQTRCTMQFVRAVFGFWISFSTNRC
jgi:hypothetical protein